MIPILCMSCDVHLFNSDNVRLHFPLAGEMFDSVVPNIRLRPGYLNLDIFCPVCGAYPFRQDSYKTGFRGVSRYLKTRGEDGKKEVRTVEDILVTVGKAQEPPDDPVAAVEVVDKGKVAAVKPASAWPCVECGAKAKIHRKGCSKIVSKVKKADVADIPKSEKDRVLEQITQEAIKSVMEKVERVREGETDPRPTMAEVAELARDREYRASRDSVVDTRPYTGK